MFVNQFIFLPLFFHTSSESVSFRGSNKTRVFFYRFKDNAQGISRDDYLKFYHFLNNINDVDTALTFYHIAGASIDQGKYQFLEKH